MVPLARPSGTASPASATGSTTARSSDPGSGKARRREPGPPGPTPRDALCLLAGSLPELEASRRTRRTGTETIRAAPRARTPRRAVAALVPVASPSSTTTAVRRAGGLVPPYRSTRRCTGSRGAAVPRVRSLRNRPLFGAEPGLANHVVVEAAVPSSPIAPKPTSGRSSTPGLHAAITSRRRPVSVPSATPQAPRRATASESSGRSRASDTVRRPAPVRPSLGRRIACPPPAVGPGHSGRLLLTAAGGRPVRQERPAPFRSRPGPARRPCNRRTTPPGTAPAGHGGRSAPAAALIGPAPHRHVAARLGMTAEGGSDHDRDRSPRCEREVRRADAAGRCRGGVSQAHEFLLSRGLQEGVR